MEIKCAAYFYIGLLGFGYFNLPVRFRKPEAQHFFNILAQKNLESPERSIQGEVSFFQGPQKMLVLDPGYLLDFRKQAILDPLFIPAGESPEISLPGR